ncbi:hypothetical protein [Mesorhizobium sp. ES1-1]|uniref:hypothetical protein n=1 Tax=Mesorhizobium sp. ES1-1 TaxID=2876629 RepID=UPI001CCC7EAD|nr:hypothetical protein [Mesorhizobium sp. ES1-1]MBZ9677603.1 hypothetical protein [Mesorhizobium sp. ES1-1]
MPRTSPPDLAAQASLGADHEITTLLSAIEQEKVPDRLTQLAIELQNALVQKRRHQTTN